MKKYLLLTIVVLLSFLVAMPVMAQYGRGWRDDYGWGMGPGMMGGRGYGYGMGGGMMGYLIAPEVPDKLPTPKSQEWIQKLLDVLALERLSYVQYTTDAEKYNAFMPYRMVIPQEDDHVRTIERLFAAYGLPPDGKLGAIVETKTITEALELCVKMEQDLIPRYEWLVKNAADRESAGILNNLLLQTRHHLVMFNHAIWMGGRMGPGMMYGGGYGYGMGGGMMGGRGYGYGRGHGMDPGMMGGYGRGGYGGYEMGPGMMGPGYGYGPQYRGPSKPLSENDAKAQVEDYLKANRNPNLKMGSIKDVGNAFEVEIVTKNNALVDKILVDKTTGWMNSAY